MEPANCFDYEALAETKLDAGAFGYYAGGAGDELALRDNVEAFRRWNLRPRVLVDVGDVSTRTTVLGHEVAMPLLVAPTAFHRVAHPDGEVGMAQAAKDAGTIMCLSSLTTTVPSEVAAVGGQRWFQLYVFQDEGMTRFLVDQAVDGGFTAILLTVDAPVAGRRERDLRTGFAIPDDIRAVAFGRGGLTPKQVFDAVSKRLTWRDLERLAADTHLPVLVKGVVTAEDTRLACEHGAAGVVVSNHGGRQLDAAPATMDALPEVVDAAEGRIEVLMDGGVRRGTDVVKALALGASAVLAGRAPLWGLVVDGEAGARRVLRILQEEIEIALQLVGARTPADVTRGHIQRRG